MFQTSNDIFIWIEINHSGQIEPVSLELLTCAKTISAYTNGATCAIVINPDSSVIENIKYYPVDKVFIVNVPIYSFYDSAAQAFIISEICQKYAPFCLLIGATDSGRILAPRVASRLNTGLTADCTDVRYNPISNNITWIRPTFSGNLIAEIECPDHRPQMGTIRRGIFQAKKNPDSSNKIEILYQDIDCTNCNSSFEIIEKISVSKNDQNDFDLYHAKTIVAGGLGIGNPEMFSQLKQLADMLGGEVGASRSAVEAGWIDYSHQIGQSGKTVQPDLYIACGISGQLQHIAGMRNSKCIIAINNDPEAPVFQYAHYGIIGDCAQVIPYLIQVVKNKCQNPQ